MENGGRQMKCYRKRKQGRVTAQESGDDERLKNRRQGRGVRTKTSISHTIRYGQRETTTKRCTFNLVTRDRRGYPMSICK